VGANVGLTVSAISVASTATARRRRPADREAGPARSVLAPEAVPASDSAAQAARLSSSHGDCRAACSRTWAARTSRARTTVDACNSCANEPSAAAPAVSAASWTPVLSRSVHGLNNQTNTSVVQSGQTFAEIDGDTGGDTRRDPQHAALGCCCMSSGGLPLRCSTRTARCPRRIVGAHRAISPLLANLFLHYAFDAWMVREYPAVTFERYCDDAVVHCGGERQARQIRDAIAARMTQVGLELHPDKTRIVYCKDARRHGQSPPTSACPNNAAGVQENALSASVRYAIPQRRSVTKVSVQHADQLTNPSAATRCRRKALEHVNDDWCRTMHRLLKVFGTNGPIVTGDKLGRSGRISACSENMLDLGGLGQRMQVGGACRRHRRQRCFARSRSVRALGCLKRRPSCVAQKFPPLTTPSELPRSTNRVSSPRVVRLIGLEYLEYHLRAPRGKRGDLTKILLAQNDLARFPRHGSIFDHCARQQGGSAAPGRPCRPTPNAALSDTTYEP
jgi:hypothetical protein